MDVAGGNFNLSLLANDSGTSNTTTVKDYQEATAHPQHWNDSEMNSSADMYGNLFSYPGVSQIFIAIYSILSFFCVAGNGLVLTVMFRSPALHTRTNLFLSHLAMADLSVGLVCVIPNLIVARVVVWTPGHIGKFLCKVLNFFEQFNLTVSVLLLVLIATERYIAIIYPLKARQLFTRFRMYAALAVVWFASCIYNVPLLVVYVTFDSGTHIYCYRYNDEQENMLMRTHAVLSFLLTYLLPLGLMFSLYLRISVVLWQASPTNLLQAGSPNRAKNSSSRREIVPLSRGDQLWAEEKRLEAANRRLAFPGSKATTQSSSKALAVQTTNSDAVTAPCANTRDSENRSRSSCTSRTSCSSTSLCTSNTTSNDFPTSDDCRHDYVVRRPLMPGYDMEQLDQQGNSTMTPCPGGCRTECSPDSWPSLDSTFSARSTSDSFKPMPGRHVCSGFMASPKTAVSLESPFLPGDTPLSATPLTGTVSPPLTSSGNQDAVYMLRPGHSKLPASYRYRDTSCRVLRTRRKVVRLLIIVLIAFALCVLPFHIEILFRYLKPEWTLKVIGLPKYIAQILFFLNCALNPVLYSLMSDSFRRSARQALCCCVCRHTVL